MVEERIVRIVKGVQAGVRWLKEQADQLTEVRAVAATVSALVAAERNPHSNLVQRLVREATTHQLADGSWNDELWDTTWMAGAFLDARVSASSSHIERAVRFLKATQDPVDGTWYEEPFETMLVLDLLLRLEPEETPQHASGALDWLASLQNSDGMLVGTRYTGMAISLFQKLPSSDPRRDVVVRRGLDFLRSSLRVRHIWTSAAWSNSYALGALLDSGCTLDDDLVAGAVDWFLDNQDETGRWLQVSQVHDTAMAVRVLANLLTVPLVDLAPPQLAVLNVSRENGTIRVGFSPPGLGAMALSERMKLSEAVRAELGLNQQTMLAAIGRTRAVGAVSAPSAGSDRTAANEGVLKKAGRYTYGHLIPPRVQAMLERSTADHLRLDVDERLIDLPWELIHDGQDFLCTRYAAGRRLISDQAIAMPTHRLKTVRDASALVVANPTQDLPAAEEEGERVSNLLRGMGLRVTFLRGRDARKPDILLALKDHDLLHFAGHASHDADNPDESCLLTCDGEIQAFEIARFLKDPGPSIVFLNACWSAEELRNPDSYLPVMRGLGRTFMYAGVRAFIGFLVPVPDISATCFAVEFYSSVISGRSIGESVRRARIATRDQGDEEDLTWASAVFYGDPSAGMFLPTSVR